MRTTLELPDEIMRAVKVRAAQRDITLTQAISELLRSGLSASEQPQTGHRVRLPLVKTGAATVDDALSPDRIAELLADSERATLTD